MAKRKALKILILVGFSKGPSGVWQRAREEAIEFKRRGYDVTIFSSNAVKGKPDERADEFDIIEGVPIIRFPYIKLGGESYMYWNFKQEALKLNPKIIISHCYRHTHSNTALKVAKKLGCKCYCVTHAPFVEKRSIPSKIVVWFKDYFSNINKFDRIIPISKWEIPIIKQLGRGVWPQKIKRIPNPIPDIYFNKKSYTPYISEGLIFIGRFSEIKQLDVLIKGIGKSNYNNLTMVGMGEEDYVKILEDEAKMSKVNINWTGLIYDLNAKLKILDEHEIFIMSSRREAMPTALVEAMARGKIVISTRTDGAKELIKQGVNGFLYNIGDFKNLGEILNKVKEMSEEEKIKIKGEAKKSVREFKMSEVMKKWRGVFNKWKR